MPAAPVECLILGLPGSGKTRFALVLAAALGNPTVCVFREDASGRVGSRSVSAGEVRTGAVAADRQPHGLQWMTVSIPLGLGRGRREVLLVDPAGLVPGIGADEQTRTETAKTLSLLRRARFLVHLVDASSQDGPSDLDRAVVRFACTHLAGRFLVIANKMDLPASRQGLRRLRRAWPEIKVLPVSCRNSRGMPAVCREFRRRLERQPSAPGVGEVR